MLQLPSGFSLAHRSISIAQCLSALIFGSRLRRAARSGTESRLIRARYQARLKSRAQVTAWQSSEEARAERQGKFIAFGVILSLKNKEADGQRGVPCEDDRANKNKENKMALLLSLHLRACGVSVRQIKKRGSWDGTDYKLESPKELSSAITSLYFD